MVTDSYWLLVYKLVVLTNMSFSKKQQKITASVLTISKSAEIFLLKNLTILKLHNINQQKKPTAFQSVL